MVTPSKDNKEKGSGIRNKKYNGMVRKNNLTGGAVGDKGIWSLCTRYSPKVR